MTVLGTCQFLGLALPTVSHTSTSAAKGKQPKHYSFSSGEATRRLQLAGFQRQKNSERDCVWRETVRHDGCPPVCLCVDVLALSASVLRPSRICS